MTDKQFIAAIGLLTLLSVVRVASTHRVFSGTSDEPVHIFCGYEWWNGDCVCDPSHPPLARILGGLASKDLPKPLSADDPQAGNDLLYHDDQYVRNLARARIGVLPLLMLGCISVGAWARQRYSREVAVLATAIFASMPPVLAHAGLVTTDMAVAAAIPLALFALDRFLEAPRYSRGILLGVSIGLGLLSKYSFLVFFPLSALTVVAVRWPIRIRMRPLLIAGLAALLVYWSGYRFDFGRPADAFEHSAFWVEHSVKEGPARSVMHTLAYTPMPSPLYLVGFGLVKIHDRDGHDAYLLGQHSRFGWWYFFPVVFFYKTPIPMLLLIACGVVILIRGRTRAGAEFLLAPLVILLVGMTSSINIGIRHVLPIYGPLAILSAHAAASIWRGARTVFVRASLIALMTWLFAGVALGHPDYLAWFNGMAGSVPSKITVDSNLDWGQDIYRLKRAVRELGVETVTGDIFHSARLEAHGIRFSKLPPHTPTSGWVVISEHRLRISEPTSDYAWLRLYRPVRQVGKSIRLYYIPRSD